MISKPLSPSLSAVIPAELCGHLSTFTGKLRGRDHHFVQTEFDCPDGQRGGRLLADCGVDQLGKNASVLFTTAPEMFGLLVGGSDAVDHVLHAWEAGDGHFERDPQARGWRVQHAECAIEFRGTDVGKVGATEQRQKWQIKRMKERALGTGRAAQRARAKLRKIEAGES